jgi:mono/diheme cytochrome c family protein
MTKAAVTALALVIWAGAAYAFMSGDPVAGSKFAKKNCAGCHAIAEEGAPEFVAIAKDEDTYTLRRIRDAIETPHWPSKRLMLTSKQADNVVAYLMSIRNH